MCIRDRHWSVGVCGTVSRHIRGQSHHQRCGCDPACGDLWRRDAAKAVRNLSAPAADDRHFAINGNKQEEYAQNNWMLVSLPVELYNQVNEKSTVTSITGTLDEKLNVAMTATNVVVGEDADFAPNTYCAINFIGESGVKGTNPV